MQRGQHYQHPSVHLLLVLFLAYFSLPNLPQRLHRITRNFAMTADLELRRIIPILEKGKSSPSHPPLPLPIVLPPVTLGTCVGKFLGKFCFFLLGGFYQRTLIYISCRVLAKAIVKVSGEFISCRLCNLLQHS